MFGRLTIELTAVALLATLALPGAVRAQDAAGAAGPVGPAAGAASASAEPAPRGDAAEPEESPPAEPARAAHVGELASRTRVLLQRARPLYRADGDVLDIARELPRAEREVARLRDPARMAPIARLSQREIADLRQQWRRRGDTYETWQATLNDRASELESVRNELVTLRRSWRELRAHALASGAAESRMSRILQSLEALREADDQIDARLEEVLDLQERVSELGIAVEDVMDQLRAAAAAYRERLLVRDRPPLWIGLEDASTAPAEDRRTLAERALAALAPMARLGGGLAQLGTVFAFLAALAVALWRRSRAWDDSAPATARAVASRPISTALLVTLLSTPLVMPHAPIVLYDVVFVAMLAPLARVLLALVPSHVRALVIAAASLLFVNRLEAMGSEDAALGRVLLLVEAAAAIAVAAWWLARAPRSGEDLVAARVRPVLVATAIASALALVANVLGYVFLAKTLLRGTGFSLSSGLSLLAMVRIAEGLIDLALRGSLGAHLRTVRDHGATMRRRTVGTIELVAMLSWIVATIAGYGLWNPLENRIEALLERRWTIGTLDVALRDVMIAIAILATTLVLSRVVRFFLDIELLPRMKLEPGVDGAISGLTRYVLVAIGILLALAAVGIDASQIAIVAGALGVGVGFGLQGIVANVIAGLVLMLERPVRLGDFIEVGPLVGRVERIGLRSSTVRAADGAEVIVPNEQLISKEVVNWTLSDRRRRIQVRVGVAYGTDPRRTLQILERVAASQQGVLGTAAIEAMFEGFGASSLDFVLQFWTDDFANALALKSQVGLAVHDALVEAGIEIPFPQQDVHVKSLPASVAPTALP